MPELILPDVRVRASFLAAMHEVVAEGATAEAANMGGEGTRYGAHGRTEEGFDAYLAAVRADGGEEAPRGPGLVPQTTFWWVQETEYLGRIAVRHRLNEFLLGYGGHIGYYVVPSRRRCGNATAMLREVLPRAAGLGIDPALVTCDEDNHASRRVIEAAGGVLEDQRGVKLRYWVPTGR